MHLFDIGDAVEEMVRRGKSIMDDAIAKYRPVAIFAGFSGGNDSIVATHFACENFGATAIHANTRIGIEKTRIHARQVAARFGWSYSERDAPLSGPPTTRRDGTPFDASVLPAGSWHDGATAYEEWCFNFGMPGPGQHARMYQRLKERSFDAWKREAKVGQHRNATVMFVTGIRHDESAVRAGYQRDTHKVGGSVWVNPFYWQTASDFEAYRQEFGLPRNPVSARIGISGECLCGTMGTPDELIGVREVEPDTADYIATLETKCASLGLPCQWASRPTRKSAECAGQLHLLFGDEPDFMPACVGCIRRQSVK